MNLPVNPKDVEKIMKAAAQQFIVPRYQNLSDHEVGSKTSPQDQVTIADHEAEAFLHEQLVSLLPESLFVGEELVHDKPDTLHLLNEKDQYIWVVDPLDGTRSFINASNDFGVMVALVKNDVPVAGWIYNILQDKFLYGAEGICTIAGQKHPSPHYKGLVRWVIA